MESLAERHSRKIAHEVAGFVPDGWEFCVVLQSPDGTIAVVNNCEEDEAKLLHRYAAALENHEQRID